MSSEVALKHFLALSGVSEPGPDGDDVFSSASPSALRAQRKEPGRGAECCTGLFSPLNN